MMVLGSDAVSGLSGNWKLLFWLLVVCAFVLRIWGVGYGLPHVYWIDEYHEVMRALELGSGSFNFSRTSKGGFYYVLFFEYGVYYVALKLSGVVAGTKEFAEQFVRDPTMFYLMGRVTAAVVGTATVAAAFYLGRQAYSTGAGLFAALFTTVNILHVDLSHRVGVDVPMTLMATISLYFGAKIATSGQRRDYVLAGLCAGLATTSKLPAILLVVPLLVAHAYAVANLTGSIRTWFTSRSLWLAVLTFVGVLVLTNPGIVFNVGYFVDTAFAATEGIADESFSFDEVQPLFAGRPNLYVFYAQAVLDSMGWPVFLLSVAAVAYALWKRRAPDVMLVSFGLVNYLVIAGTSSDVLYYPRYALPIIIVLLVLAGRLSRDILLIFPRWRQSATAIGAGVLVAWPVMQVSANNQELSHTDTRTIAKEWIDSNVPFGSRVLIEGGKIAPSRETVPLEESPESLDRRIAYWMSEDPRQARFLQIKRSVSAGAGYELEIVKPDTVEDFDAYVARGVEYFVVRPESLESSRRAELASIGLLEKLRNDPSVRLIKVFEAAPGIRTGPRIEVYQLRPNGTRSE